MNKNTDKRYRVCIATGVEITGVMYCDTLDEAIKAADYNAGSEFVDEEHGCSEDLYSTSAVGRCYVEDMSTAEYDEDGECVEFPEEVYSTDYFYTNL